MRGRCLSAVGAVLAIALFTLAASPCTAVLRTVLENTASATLVIDAGHGGFDGGAVSERGVSEQAINLSVAQRVRALACFFGVQTAMTRADEGALDYDPSRSVRENKVADIHARERIVQSISSPVFVSIHLNKFSDPQYHGAQVFYSANRAFGKPLAEALQSALISGCDPENRRQAKQAESSVYLMRVLTCPAVIVECGFLSNPDEETRLADENYHKKLAVCIVTGYLRYTDGHGG